MYGCHLHEKDHTQYALCGWLVLGKIGNTVLVGQVSRFIKKSNIEIFSDTINATIIFKLHSGTTELYLFIALSLTLTIVQCVSSVKQFFTENVILLST